MSEEKASKLPSRSVVLALMKEGVSVKEKTSEIAGKYGERVRAQVENDGMDRWAFRAISDLYRLSKVNELKAKDRLAHFRAYAEWLEEEMSQKGHVGNLADMAKETKPSPAQAVAGVSAPEPVPATGGLTTEQALAKFRENQSKAPDPADVEKGQEERAKARAAKATKKPKLAVVQNEPEPVDPPEPKSIRLEDDDGDWNKAAPTPPEPALASA